jgi:hypothetical protein
MTEFSDDEVAIRDRTRDFIQKEVAPFAAGY